MRKLLTFAAFMSLAVGVAACTGGDDDADGATTASPTASATASPTASPTAANFSLTFTSWPHASGGVRVLEGTTRVYCKVGTAIGGMTWTTATNGLFAPNTAYTVEVYGDNGTTANQYDAGDHIYKFNRGATTTSNMALTYDHGSGQITPTTWPAGTGCP